MKNGSMIDEIIEACIKNDIEKLLELKNLIDNEK